MNRRHIFICPVHIIFILSVFYSFHGLIRTQQIGLLRPHGFSLRKRRHGKPSRSTRLITGCSRCMGPLSRLVEYYSANTEAMCLNPVEIPKLLLLLLLFCCWWWWWGRGDVNLQLLNLLWQLERSCLHLNDSANISLAILRLSVKLRRCRVELHYEIVFGNAFTSFILLIAKRRRKMRLYMFTLYWIAFRADTKIYPV